MKHCFFLLLLLFNFCTHSYAEWRVSDLARSPSEHIQLRDQQNNIIKTISTQQMVYLYAAMQSISHAAELNAEFIITAGDIPNAFATITNNNIGIIAINLAMLDIIGNDLDMAASIIGHELAHLKLHHLSEHINASIRNRNQSFSAKNTKYSRDNEREADYLGVIWAIEAGYNPEGAIRLQQALYDLYKESDFPITSISHPSSIERLTILKSLVRRFNN